MKARFLRGILSKSIDAQSSKFNPHSKRPGPMPLCSDNRPLNSEKVKSLKSRNYNETRLKEFNHYNKVPNK